MTVTMECVVTWTRARSSCAKVEHPCNLTTSRCTARSASAHARRSCSCDRGQQRNQDRNKGYVIEGTKLLVIMCPGSESRWERNACMKWAVKHVL